ncbi:MAG: type I-U CRISPR-associated helicase/endonuclease Cas3, partial [Deltaproteobacteria bacterium]|nr:type I-U CRISPR-associated helicase/endonuclease Cas3 [Deltaproteobacteria bacterium]
MISFIDFFELIHGQLPFPWQTEVAERLVLGKDVDAISVPTGCGKTAMIDAAVYYAALGGPKRIFFIIDRRVVIDEAHTRAEKIRLEISERSELKEIQERLGPIRVLRLRGGIHIDDDWIWYPEETVIVLSTVDQVGSRLLHRGYGVSPRMWPLHAGFVGDDAFYIVDEAHQSLPFTATVKTAIRNGANVRLVEMSATPSHTLGQGLELSDKDKRNPVLKKRLTARKRTKMEVVRGGDEQFTDIAVAKALEVSGREQFIVAVVVNRVGMARRIWQELSRRKEPAVLLTGRIRPFDRDLLMMDLFPQICTGRDRKDSRRVFVVATQTIEVGADIDFDALVTEAAPLSALRQRFGRLDRIGELRETQAWILAREKDIDPDTAIKAPVYGEDIHKAWKWLENVRDLNQQVDFGFEGMQRTLEKVPAPKETPIHCPALLPTHIDILAQTGPEALYVDPAPWLHGPKKASYDVNIIWRRDLPTERPEDWPEHIIYRPPLIQET